LLVADNAARPSALTLFSAAVRAASRTRCKADWRAGGSRARVMVVIEAMDREGLNQYAANHSVAIVRNDSCSGRDSRSKHAPDARVTSSFESGTLSDLQPSPSTVRQRFSASRISRSKTTSSGGAVGAGGGASFFSRLICLTIMKMMKARITKLIATVMKLP